MSSKTSKTQFLLFTKKCFETFLRLVANYKPRRVNSKILHKGTPCDEDMPFLCFGEKFLPKKVKMGEGAAQPGQVPGALCNSDD